MKNRLDLVILVLGVLLILGSFTAYGVRVSHAVIPAGASPAEVEQLTQRYGLDRPLAIQYGTFLLFFLPGLTVLGIYGTLKMHRRVLLLSIVTRAFIVLLLFTNALTALNYLLFAPQSVEPFSLYFWLTMILAGLVLANFVFLLVIWNGYKWGLLGFIVASSLAFILNLIGGVPVVPTIFNATAPVVIYFLLRPVWANMQ